MQLPILTLWKSGSTSFHSHTMNHLEHVPRLTPHGDGYRPDIEGLRGIAVALVVAYHGGLLGASGGFIGVDVFFVLSGYLITGILVRQFERTGRLDLWTFYARRMLRLLPAATLVLLVTLVVGLVLLGPMERIEPSLSGVANALYLSNVFFLSRAMDYFAAGADTNPMLHTWSLAVEEQFYLAWPVLVLLGFRVARTRRRLFIGAALLSALSFALSLVLTYKRQPWAFFGTPARAWEFGLGAMASLVSVTTAATWRPALGWAGLALLLAGAWALHSGVAFPGVAALAPTLGTMAMLLAGAGSADGVSRLLAAPPLQWIGKRSYSWYLWHWPVLVFATAYHPAQSWWERSLWMAGALVLASAMLQLFENPIRFSPRFVGRPRLAVGVGLACTLSSALLALAFYRGALAQGGALYDAAHAPSQLAESGCIAGFDEATPRECVYGDTASRSVVVLIGDSHANQWFPAIDAIARRNGWRLLVMTKYSCPVARVPAYNRVLRRAYTECEAWRAAAVRRLRELNPVAVIIGQFARGETKQIRADGTRDTVTYDEWRDGMRATLTALDSAQIATIIIRDSPHPGVNVPTCLSHAAHTGTTAAVCGRSRVRALDSLTFGAERAAAAGLVRVAFVDVSDEICDSTQCGPIRDELVVYRDGNHLALAFVEHLERAIARQLEPLVSGFRQR